MAIATIPFFRFPDDVKVNGGSAEAIFFSITVEDIAIADLATTLVALSLL